MFDSKPSGLIFEERIKRIFRSLGFEIISLEDLVGAIRPRKFMPDFFIRGVKPPFEILALVEVKHYKGKVPAQVIHEVDHALDQYPEASKAVIVSSIGFTDEAREIAERNDKKYRLALTTEAELLEKLPENVRRDFTTEYAFSALYNEKLQNYFIFEKYQRSPQELLDKISKEQFWKILTELVKEDELLRDFSSFFGREVIHNIISESSVRKIWDFALRQQESLMRAIEPEKNRLRELYEQSKSENDPNKKGRLLEEVVAGMINLVNDLKVHKRNVRTDKEEIDLLTRNKSKEEPWTHLGPMIFVECKNWSRPVGSSHIGVFRTKLMDHQTDSGIFVAVNGITGKGSFQAARAQIRDAWRIHKKRIFVLDGKDIDSILKCTRLTDIIEERFCELWEI